MGLPIRNIRSVFLGSVSLLVATIFSSTSGCSRRESSRLLPASASASASASAPPCPVRLANVTFEACNLDPKVTSGPDCFYFFVLVRPRDERSACVPGRVKLAILGSARYQTDELVATTSLVSGDKRSAVVELRLESMIGSQGFFEAPPPALVGRIYTSAAGAERFELGPALLPSALNDRTARVTDILF